MSSQSPNSAESMIQEARRHYVGKRFKPALEQFTRAMKLCPCNRGMRRERCSCKDFEKVALEGGSIFKEAMYNCKCSVGKTFNKCDNPLHIQALDYRAATFEAIPDLNRAQKDAEWILELAPRLLDGYLRLGKIARLRKKYEFAWNVYNAGIEVGQQLGPAASSKMQALYALRQPLQLRFSRLDPLKNPQEIVHRIFHFIDFLTLVRCLRVSKDWRQYLISHGNERLWRSLIFKKQASNRPAPRSASLKKLMSYSGSDVRELVIGSVPRFGLTQPKFLALLQGSRNLERLTLRGYTDEKIEMPQRPGILNKLTHVHLEEFLVSKLNFLSPLLHNASESLQSLHIAGLPQLGSRTDLGFPDMPKLKYLRLEEHGRPYPLRLQIFLLASKTPNLQQLWLSNVNLGNAGLEDDQLDTIWRDLKAALARDYLDDFDPETAESIQRLISIRRGSDFQHLELDFRCSNNSHESLGLSGLQPSTANQGLAAVPAGDSDQGNHFDDLRSLRLAQTYAHPGELQAALGGAIATGKLDSLDIVFPLYDWNGPEGAQSVQHVHGYAWLRGAASIRTLGIFEFHFRSFPRDENDMPLPGFVASFPNLETLEINSTNCENTNFCAVIQAILKETKLRRIYQSTVKGVMLDQLTAVARKLGVELIWGGREREWPLPIEE